MTQALMFTYQKPYMEQQFPFGQFPQTVLPFPAPQVPSVVTAPVAAPAAAEVEAMTGSPLVVVVGFVGVLPPEEDDDVPVQPF
jgi:hypothetical protein